MYNNNVNVNGNVNRSKIIIIINMKSIKLFSLKKYAEYIENIKKIIPKILKSFFLIIFIHSFREIKKMIVKKKTKITEPLIITKNENGIKIKELNILFCSSIFIKYSQNFSLYS